MASVARCAGVRCERSLRVWRGPSPRPATPPARGLAPPAISSVSVPGESGSFWKDLTPAAGGPGAAGERPWEEPVLWIAFLLGFVGVVVLVGVVRERRRSRALGRVASGMGLAFAPRDPELGGQPFMRLPVLAQGQRRISRNVAGGDGLFVFDHRYATGSGRRRYVRRTTVAAVRIEGAPRLRGMPAGWVDRDGDRSGLRDVVFEGDADFARVYQMRGESAEAVRGHVPEALRRRLGADPDWVLEVGAGWLVAFRDGKRVAPDALPAFVGAVEEMARLLGTGD